jgi:predicted transcriptional regulator
MLHIGSNGRRDGSVSTLSFEQRRDELQAVISRAPDSPIDVQALISELAVSALPVKELRERVGMPSLEFNAALSAVLDLGLVQLHRAGKDAKAELTETGRVVAGLE